MSVTATDGATETPGTATVRRSTAPYAILAAGILVFIALFWTEAVQAVQVWDESTAYGHCFLVAPIAAYLIWDRRESLRGLVPCPAPLLALLAAPLPFAWLVAERLGIMEGRQIIAITALQVLFLAVLGWRMYRAMLGPLLYLYFLVPFGAFVTPALQAFTADFIEVGLTVLGIPHVITEMTIEIPYGAFYVAEACAGLRFLIASVAFGVFFALLNYRSTTRRTVFIAASIAVPVIANGFRALGIVVLGYMLGSAEAAAADHLIYGWVFFSVVLLLLVAAGLPFREAGADGPVESDPHAPSAPHGAIWAVAAVLAIAAIGPAAAKALDLRAPTPQFAEAPVLTPPAGCTLEPGAAPGPDRTQMVVACGGMRWVVLLRVLSANSTRFAVNDALRRMIPVAGGEESRQFAIPDAPGWVVTVDQKPLRISAQTVWIDGTPAAGGLRQRLQMAAHSIFGNNQQPIIAVIAGQTVRPLLEGETKAATDQLDAIATSLNAQLPKLGSRHLP